MAKNVVTVQIMPCGVESDLQKIQADCEKLIETYGSVGQKKIDIIPIAFGLKSIQIIFMVDEKIAQNTEKLEEDLSRVDDVNQARVIDVRRPLG